MLSTSYGPLKLFGRASPRRLVNDRLCVLQQRRLDVRVAHRLILTPCLSVRFRTDQVDPLAFLNSRDRAATAAALEYSREDRHGFSVRMASTCRCSAYARRHTLKQLVVQCRRP